MYCSLVWGTWECTGSLTGNRICVLFEQNITWSFWLRMKGCSLDLTVWQLVGVKGESRLLIRDVLTSYYEPITSWWVRGANNSPSPSPGDPLSTTDKKCPWYFKIGYILEVCIILLPSQVLCKLSGLSSSMSVSLLWSYSSTVDENILWLSLQNSY